MKKQNLFLNKKRSSNNASKEKLKRKKTSKQVKIRGPWSEREDKLLMDWIEIHGPKSWARCAETIKGRNGKQCREHWNNNLKSNLIKGQWSAEEDLLIMKFYAKYKSWRKIIPIFKDRAENSIKNRFFSQLRKIAIRNQEPGKKEYGIKIKLDRLTTFIDEATKVAEERYFNENKNMTKKDFDNFISKIEEELNKKDNKEKGIKYIDLESLKKNINKTIIYPTIFECTILISNADEKAETNKNEKVEKTEKLEKLEKSKSFNDINNNNYLKVPKLLPKLNSFLKIKKGLEKDNNQKNMEQIKEDANGENKNSENNSSINSEEVDDPRPFEPKGKGNNSGFETFLQTTRNIEEIKKGKKLSILTIKN